MNKKEKLDTFSLDTPKSEASDLDEHEKRLGGYLDKKKKEKFSKLGKPIKERLEEIRRRREELENEINSLPSDENPDPTIFVELEDLQEEERELLDKSDLPI